MLTKTSETALRVLLHLLRTNAETPVPPGSIAAHLGTSPTYTAKVTTQLVKADILRAHRGGEGRGDAEPRAGEDLAAGNRGGVPGEDPRRLLPGDGGTGLGVRLSPGHAGASRVDHRDPGALDAGGLGSKKPGPSPALKGLAHCRFECMGEECGKPDARKEG